SRSSKMVMAWFLSGAFCAALVPSGAAPGDPAPADPRQQMIAVLAADAPSPALGAEARLWDRFVGTWDADYSFIAAAGKVTHTPGELEFGWVLDGLAIQDLWISYPLAGQTERTIGTSLRYYDEKAKLWHIVFVAPKFAATLQVAGGMEGDRIVL